VSEFAARDAFFMEKLIALRQDVTFYKKGKLCSWNDPEAVLKQTLLAYS
jgi:hypothetical protein